MYVHTDNATIINFQEEADQGNQQVQPICVDHIHPAVAVGAETAPVAG